MNAGKITAKLRDAVPVRFMVDGEEVKQYRNIDIPDALKELGITDFKFDVSADRKISFQLFFDTGILPKEFPEARAKMTRAEKAAAKEATKEATTLEAAKKVIVDTAAETIAAITGSEVIVNVADPVNADGEQPSEDGNIEVAYDMTGEQRKALVTAIGEIIGETPIYKGAPTYAFAIGDYLVSRYGTLTGAANPALINTLEERGFIAE